MKRSSLAAVIAGTVTMYCSAQRPETVAMSQIRPEAIAAHMRFLSDDLLEGRGTGTRGYEIAAKYVAAQFEAIGLEPAGTGRSYFQTVPMLRSQLVPEQSSATLIGDGREEPLVFGKDFIVPLPPPSKSRTEDSVRAPLVFVGFGVEAPEVGYNDYADLNVRGKIAVMFFGAPPRFPSAIRAHFSDPATKARLAAAHGAIAVVTLWSGEIPVPFDLIAKNFQRPGFSWLNPDGRPNQDVPELHGAVILSGAASATLFRNGRKTFQQVLSDAGASKSQGFPMDLSLSLRAAFRHIPAQSPNVIGVLRGSDPKLRDEYVVFSAHVDHLGIGEAVDGDSIYNGAMDNAAGTAGLIEIARSFTRLPRHSRRSILFAAVAAEEDGQIGSDYFAHYPALPAKALVADINLDGLPMDYDFRDMIAMGEEHSTLRKFVRQAAHRMDLDVSPDPWPEQVFFIRGDQYSFVRQGVPAIFLAEGLKAADPHLDSKKIGDEWTAKIYHTPKDDMKQPLNFGAGARGARLTFLIGFLVAQADERPQWNPGDFFGRTFAGRQ